MRVFLSVNKRAAIDVSTPGVPGAALGLRETCNNVYAAIDLGTNNCRLLIARPTPDGFRVIDSFSRIVRLGEGVSANGELSEGAIERTIEALKICSEKMEKQGVTHAHSVATAACRYASNREHFTERVLEETGIELEVISAAEEARLAVSGCVSLFDDDSDYAFVFDIGGGSTELIWATIDQPGEFQILEWTSMPCGVVSLAEEYGGGNISENMYADMVADVERRLAPFEARHRLSAFIKNGQVQMIGTSGTVTTVAGIYLGLQRYDRNRVDGLWIERDHINGISHKLASMTYEERVAEPCIGVERADLVVAGCAIWEAISNTWACERLRVADRGLREGMLLDLMAEAEEAAANA